MKDSTGKDWSFGFDTFDRSPETMCCLDGLNNAAIACAKSVESNQDKITAITNSFSDFCRMIKMIEETDPSIEKKYEMGLLESGIFALKIGYQNFEK